MGGGDVQWSGEACPIASEEVWRVCKVQAARLGQRRLLRVGVPGGPQVLVAETGGAQPSASGERLHCLPGGGEGSRRDEGPHELLEAGI